MRDISNQRFGRLVAVEIHHTNNHKRFWVCRCDCGTLAVIRQDQLTQGKTKSCGCFLKESQNKNLAIRQVKKPETNNAQDLNGHRPYWNPVKHQYPRLYRIWSSMKSRCYYAKNKCFRSYGGRGIRICDVWLRSFNTFAEWALDHGYEDHLSIDRIDVNGNYCPENCRWITMTEQQKNKRKSPPSK